MTWRIAVARSIGYILTFPAFCPIGGSGAPAPGSPAAANQAVRKAATPGRSQAETPSLRLEKERAGARQIGLRLLQRYQAGSIKLVNPEREGPQIRQLASLGYVKSPNNRPVPVAPSLLHMLDRLSAGTSREKPLVLLSLYRPPRRNAREPHANGMAADIAAYAGHPIHSRRPEECVAGVLAVVQALSTGPYRLGLPKPPDTDPHPFQPAPRRPHAWPFLPAPLPSTIRIAGMDWVLPRPQPSGVASARRQGLLPWILRWENERGAPLSDVGSPRVRAAFRAAIQRGANIHTLFPDALDHLHVDVRPPG